MKWKQEYSGLPGSLNWKKGGVVVEENVMNE